MSVFKSAIILLLLSTYMLVYHATVGVPLDNVSSRLQIQIPHSLFRDEGYAHKEALFGVPPYGGSIAQSLLYKDSDFCNPTFDMREVDPPHDPDQSGDQRPWLSPFILMVDRGSCSFVQKVRNAQYAGAAGVLIADTKCLCTDQACLNATSAPSKEEQEECQNEEPIMADDGSGGDIFIPSFLMLKADADRIKSVVKQNHVVQVEMSWALPAPDDRVEYDLWTVPSEPVSKEFQKVWKTVATTLGTHAYFTPYQYIYDGIKSQCHGANGTNMCFNLCTNNGRYCATDPDNDYEHGISGADVVLESLRRVCIWKHYGESDGIGNKYWNYITEFLVKCDSAEFFANKDCVDSSLKHANIKAEDIDRCMDDSGGTTEDQPNAILDLEIAAQARRGVVVLPSIFVNTVVLRGALSVSSVFTAICAGFLPGTEPNVCSSCVSCQNVENCVKRSVCDTNGSGGAISKRLFSVTLLLICGIFGATGYFHWRKSRNDMRNQVRGILDEYMPLEGGETEDQHSSPMDFARKGGLVSFVEGLLTQNL